MGFPEHINFIYSGLNQYYKTNLIICVAHDSGLNYDLT